MVGTRVGPYEVVAKLGEGGMGEVYRARDTQLNRNVALKVLPELFANDPDRLERFSREAQVLASLNHPNIAAIYGIEQRALVMELVEGEDLSGAIGRGPIPLAEALPIARQIADALEAAHEQGIVHRDLKPANVKVRPDGTVKVLDFGLAKALSPLSNEGSSAADAMNSPTLTARATQLGMILGTAAYMAPEQAKGKPVDRRADIWAFGVVLYEMLSGRRAFEGEDVSTTMAAVLMKDPDWNALPASTPAAVGTLIRRCVERDSKLRLRDIGEARIILSSPQARDDRTPATPVAAAPAPAPIVPWLLAALGLGAAAVTIGLNVPGGRSTTPEPVQFKVTFPPNVRPLSNGSDYHGGVISPNGRLVTFSGADEKTGKIAIYVRRVDAIEATIVKNTEGGRYPFWAPSSNTIAFYARGKLNRVDLDGGSPMVICDAPTGGWGGSWNNDDIIIAGVTDPGPIIKVSAKGGDTPQAVTKVDAAEVDHDWPHFLPDGRHFIYTAWGSLISGTTTFKVGSLESGTYKIVRKDTNQIHPMAFAAPGFVLFIREGTLMAQRFDVAKFELQGDPVALAASASGPIIASATGALSYVTTQTTTAWNRMVTVNADGTNERPLLEPGFYNDPNLSPSGTLLAYARKESVGATHDIYVRDMATGREQQLTFDPADDRAPVWSPTGDEIVFSSQRQPIGLYRKRADGFGDEKLITSKDAPQTWPYQWHANGFITSYGDTGASYDTHNLSLADFKTTPLLNKPGVNEMRASVSPGGRWLTYDERATSRFEVFLTTHPVSVTTLPVTSEGGAAAKWSKDGNSLFYVNVSTGALMVATVTPGDPPTFTGHRQVHPGPLDWGWNSAQTYDIDQKTGRLVLEVLVATGDLTVLLNWQALVK